MPSDAKKTIINSLAPIRVCDIGGWTDTWFAGHGRVFNIAVCPSVEVQIEVVNQGQLPTRERITLVAENYGDRYAIDEGQWGKHPLLEAAIRYMGVPEGLAVTISIFSEVPAGCSTGTSASVSVALLGALAELSQKRLTPMEVAYAAHKIETEILHQQSGIQDQLCAAVGGINYIEMFQYPHASVSQIRIPHPLWWELERRLCLIHLGKAHTSTEIHKMVIRDLENMSPDNPKLDNLRRAATRAKEALYNGDLPALGISMIQNNEYQRDLNPRLISPEADLISSVAERYEALGWKVNGAGGEGGSLTTLSSPDMSRKRAMIRAIEELNPQFRHIPIALSPQGLRVWYASD